MKQMTRTPVEVSLASQHRDNHDHKAFVRELDVYQMSWESQAGGWWKLTEAEKLAFDHAKQDRRVWDARKR